MCAYVEEVFATDLKWPLAVTTSGLHPECPAMMMARRSPMWWWCSYRFVANLHCYPSFRYFLLLCLLFPSPATIIKFNGLISLSLSLLSFSPLKYSNKRTMAYSLSLSPSMVGNSSVCLSAESSLSPPDTTCIKQDTEQRQKEVAK